MKTPELLMAMRRLVSSLPPGTALPVQRELCARFGVTTFTLHQSLRLLEREGMVVVTPRKGIFTKERRTEAPRVVQMIYLDNPEAMRIREYGLSAFVTVTSRQRMQCRVVHLSHEDHEGFRNAFAEASDDPACPGVVVSGFVSPAMADILGRLTQPWVLFGDGQSPRALQQLPVVAGDGFQGGQLVAQQLVSRGVEHVVLVNFMTRPDWPWVCEARAGVMSVLGMHPAVKAFLPEIDCVAAPVEFESAVQTWSAGTGSGRVGILCRNRNALHIATSVRRMFDGGARAELALMDVEQHPLELPDVEQVFCSMEDLAEVSLRRLAAMRYGVDARGRVCVPFKALPRAGSALMAGAAATVVAGTANGLLSGTRR